MEETFNTGYAITATCDDGSDPSLIFLQPGEIVTCTFINEREPQLKLVKTVTNNDGGNKAPDDWTLSATAARPNDWRNFNNLGGSGDFQTVFAGVEYFLAESDVAGYQAGTWSCDGGTLVGSTITLGIGDQVTCTINNDDIAGTAATFNADQDGSQ